MEVSHVLITFVLRVRSITVHEINSLPVGHVLETLPGALRGDRLSWDSDLMAPSKCGRPVRKPSRWAVTRAVTLLPPLPARPSWPLVPTAVTAKHFSSQLSVFACLFFVAPSQQCSFLVSFLVSFLLVSLNRSLQCLFFFFFPQNWAGSSQWLSISFYKAPNIKFGISYPASNIGNLVASTPSEDSRVPFSME